VKGVEQVKIFSGMPDNLYEKGRGEWGEDMVVEEEESARWKGRGQEKRKRVVRVVQGCWMKKGQQLL